jgi:hypothetical protein
MQDGRETQFCDSLLTHLIWILLVAECFSVRVADAMETCCYQEESAGLGDLVKHAYVVDALARIEPITRSM